MRKHQCNGGASSQLLLSIVPCMQGAMYKEMDIEVRARQIREINSLLDQLERLCRGPYFVSSQVSTADAAAFPHFVFMLDMLPQYFGWKDVFAGRPKLKSWWDRICSDQNAEQVCNSTLHAWLIRHHNPHHQQRLRSLVFSAASRSARQNWPSLYVCTTCAGDCRDATGNVQVA